MAAKPTTTAEQALMQKIGYTFDDHTVLRQALTHRSYGADHNERLEFYGDAVLNAAVAASLYWRYPSASEGMLTQMRAQLVCQASLVRIAQSLAISELLILGEGERKSGGKTRPSILADCVEALFGAVAIDAAAKSGADNNPANGFAAAAAVIERCLAPYSDQALSQQLSLRDAKTRLQEQLQGAGLALPCYRLVAAQQPAQGVEPHFVVRCTSDDLGKSADGEGRSRKQAEQNAAAALLSQIGE